MEFVNKVKFLLGFPISVEIYDECIRGVPNFVTAFAVNVRAMNLCYISMFTTSIVADAVDRLPLGIALEDLVKFFGLSKEDMIKFSRFPGEDMNIDITDGDKLNDYNLYRALCDVQKTYEGMLALWFWGYVELADLYLINVLISIHSPRDYEHIKKRYNSYSGSYKVHFPQARLYALHNPHWKKAMFRSDSSLIEYFNLDDSLTHPYALSCDYVQCIDTTYSWWVPNHDYKGDLDPIPYERIGIPVFVGCEDFFDFLLLNPRADGRAMASVAGDPEESIQEGSIHEGPVQGESTQGDPIQGEPIHEGPIQGDEPEQKELQQDEPGHEESGPDEGADSGDTIAYTDELEDYFKLATKAASKYRGSKKKKSVKQKKQDRQQFLRQQSREKAARWESFPTLPLQCDQDKLPKIPDYIKSSDGIKHSEVVELSEVVESSEVVELPGVMEQLGVMELQETLDFPETPASPCFVGGVAESLMPVPDSIKANESSSTHREKSAYSKIIKGGYTIPAFDHLHNTLSVNSYALVDGSNVSPPVLYTFISALRNESRLAHIHLVFDSEPLFRWDLWGQGKVSYEVATRTSLRKNSADILIGFRLATLMHTLDYTKFVLISSDADFACLCKDMQDRIVVITEESAVSDRYLEFLNSSDIPNYVLQDFKENSLLQKLLKLSGGVDSNLAIQLLSSTMKYK